MTELLIRTFIADYAKTDKPGVRGKYGMLSGMVGIAVNLVLFAVKITAGILSGAISIVADAFNNLSDAGSSIATLLGFKLAGRPADEAHPFGHGRIEYLAGLFIAVAIILVGAELLRTSVGKIIEPAAVQVSGLAVGILLASVGLKFWLGSFYRNIGGRINSTAVEAAAVDSFNDCIATAVVLLSLAVNYFFGVNIDGFAGVAIACFIFYSGIRAVWDTLQPLLGQAPDPQFVRDIAAMAEATDGILGVHDLIVHDYGPGRLFVSLHAEIPAAMDMMRAHEIIDAMEYRLQQSFHCEVTVHMDPIAVADPQTVEIGGQIAQIVRQVDSSLTMHDFRMTHGGRGLKFIFDVAVPASCRCTDEALREQIKQAIARLNSSYDAVIKIDRLYI